MGFNITQIINKILSVSVAENKAVENPFGTKEGQSIVSISESMEARYARESRIKSTAFYDKALTQGADSYIITIVGRAGYLIIPLFISVGADGPGIASISYKLKDTDTAFITLADYIGSTGGTFKYQPNGAIRVGSASTISLAFKATNASNKGYGSIVYVEVPE